MLDKFFQKSLSFDDAKKVALAESLIDVNSLNANDYNIVLDVVRGKKRFPIPEKFLKAIPTNTLFDYADKKEVAKELIARSEKPDFELPKMSGYYGKIYTLLLSLQKALVKHFVKLELKELKLWQKILDEKIWQEIFKLRRKAGAEKARITRKENPHKPKDDPLLEVIRDDVPARLNYYRFDELKRERFFSLLPEWLKAGDRVKSAIFETPYVKELNEEQYLQVFKSWLKDSYGYKDIECLKLGTLRKLDVEEWYYALEKFLNNRIEKIEPLPTLNEVKQKLLPKLLSNNEDTEEVYLKYKEGMLRGEVEKLKNNGRTLNNFFSEEEIKKIKTIIAAFDRYSPDNDELKLKTDFLEWVLTLPEGKKEALCNYLCKSKS